MFTESDIVPPPRPSDTSLSHAASAVNPESLATSSGVPKRPLLCTAPATHTISTERERMERERGREGEGERRGGRERGGGERERGRERERERERERSTGEDESGCDGQGSSACGIMEWRFIRRQRQHIR